MEKPDLRQLSVCILKFKHVSFFEFSVINVVHYQIAMGMGGNGNVTRDSCTSLNASMV